ncbi:MAG: efflux RND transporter permease subunit [Kofleriaceae bacterium]|nr:efflux RND transporter permease subunit [Kofleriaceae bacterium]
MNLSAPFIRRTVGTTLLTIALALAGMVAFTQLPVSALPRVDFPTIQVTAGLPGAAPEIVASSIVAPLEHQLGRIAGVTEMTSISTLGTAQIVLQFDLERDIDAAGRDVQAAINASQGYLPANLPMRPSYRKVNPADAPILVLSLTSPTYDRPAMYDAASTVIAQRLSQIEGVGQVIVGGSSLPAVRVEVDPSKLAASSLDMEDLRRAIAAANSNRPKGALRNARETVVLGANDQLRYAAQYAPLVVGSSPAGATVRLRDVANVIDSVEDIRVDGRANGKPAVLMIVFRQPGANIIATVDRVRELLPSMEASIPAGLDIDVVVDRTLSIRASVRDVELTLVGSVLLVVLVVFAFLREWRSAVIASIAVPISLLGATGVMYLADYSIDNLSLMALTIATGFVVDDAIVVVENVQRHLEQGMAPREAAFLGAKEIGFTVLSISISLIAVFIPILLMGGIVGRLFREFAVTLSVAVLVSLAISLTTTPMLCARLLRPLEGRPHGRWYHLGERALALMTRMYSRSLGWVLRHTTLVFLVALGTVALTGVLFVAVPKGFFPQQDTGRLVGTVRGDQDLSAQAMAKLVAQLADITGADPAVRGTVAFTSGNSGRLFATLAPHSERTESADQIIARLRPKLSEVPGATLYLQATQDLQIGGRASASQFQYVLQSTDIAELTQWAPRLLARLRTVPGLVDVNSDLQDRGRQVYAMVDRDRAATLGLSARDVDEILYDMFGQRQVSTTYGDLNQYHVVLEIDPAFAASPAALELARIRPPEQAAIMLPTISTQRTAWTPLTIAHQGGMPAVTLSFNLQPGVSLGEAVQRIAAVERELGMPASIRSHFSGTAQAFQESLRREPYLLAAALLAVYLVLGILYESLLHPITILSTLPSAGIGALLALMLLGLQLDVMAMIGVLLLIGIVKKNAILVIDFALVAQREEGMAPRDAIFRACQLRFRPITMTTMAAMLGAMPLALGLGAGAELRQPLGVAIVGGLIVSQAITLYTTPVIYLFMERLRARLLRRRT